MNFALNQSKIVFYYQSFLASISVFVFFTNLDSYLFDIGVGPKPLLLIFAFGLLALPLLLSDFSRIQNIPASIIIGCGIYIAISLISFLLSNQSEAIHEILQARLRSVFFFVLMIFIFSGCKNVQQLAQIAIVVVLIMNIINNINELANPSIFGGLNDSGRPAGFYVNPNRTSFIFVIGTLLCITLFPIGLRFAFIILSIFGMMLTFSRGGLLIMPIVIIIFVIFKILPKSQVLITVATISIFFTQFGISGNLTNFLIYQALDMGVDQNVIVRLQTFIDPSSSAGNDDTSRLDIIPFALQKFSQQPFFGYGIGHTEEWGQIVPHNTYLVFMIEHGFLGVFLLPLFVYLIVKNASGKLIPINYAFAISILLWGIFSHDILSERFLLLPCSLMVSMNNRSCFDKKLTQQNKKSKKTKLSYIND
jgi:O-antigen ligase